MELPMITSAAVPTSTLTPYILLSLLPSIIAAELALYGWHRRQHSAPIHAAHDRSVFLVNLPYIEYGQCNVRAHAVLGAAPVWRYCSDSTIGMITFARSQCPPTCTGALR
jgi:hypothetical protein